MNILIFNCGSSSQAFKVYQVSEKDQPKIIASGKAKNVATQTKADSFIEYRINDKQRKEIISLPSHHIAADVILTLLERENVTIDGIGHRFVHGGPRFNQSVKIDENVFYELKNSFRFAPIHNPNSFSVIEVCKARLPEIPQYAVFDTAFHAKLPKESQVYALPKKLAGEYGFRKYGFHGLSYQNILSKMPDLLGKPIEQLNLVMCHLGTGGSSVTAIKKGLPYDTSMGYSPLQGLIMSTRCGDLDPEIVLDLIRSGMSADEVDSVLNNQSGLIGLSGYSSNLIEIIDESERGNEDCQLAYDAYSHRLKSYIGAFVWLLDGADAIVFTDDLGIKSWKLREKVFKDSQNMGIRLDDDANQNASFEKPSLVSRNDSKIPIWVVPNDEEIVILNEILELIGNGTL